MLRSGKVVDPVFRDEMTSAIREFNKHLAQDTRVDISMLTVGDGTTLALKK